MQRITFAGSGVFIAAAILAHCASQSPNGDGGLDGSGATFAGTACGTCVVGQCSTAINACNGSAECSAYWSCVLGCGVESSGNVDPTCAAACPRGSSSTGATDEKALDDCRATGAGATCAACGSDGGADGGNPIIHQTCTQTTDTTPCYTCEDNKCCGTYDACHNDPECGAYKNCLVSCEAGDAGIDASATNACDEYCFGLHPSGLTEWAPRETCIFVRCLDECTTGTPDPCISCVVSMCPEEYANSQSTVDGYRLGGCIADCGSDLTCSQACQSKFPLAVGAEDALAQCTVAKCPSVCN